MDNDTLSKLLQCIATRVLQETFDNVRHNSLRCGKRTEAALHLLKLYSSQKKIATYTTCGYKTFVKDETKKVFAYFLYNSLQCGVRIPLKRSCYHTFGGNMGVHQTSVPITFDGKYVRFNDPDLFIFAWGNGKSRVRQYIENNNSNFPVNARMSQTQIRRYYDLQGRERREEMHRMNLVPRDWSV